MENAISRPHVSWPVSPSVMRLRPLPTTTTDHAGAGLELFVEPTDAVRPPRLRLRASHRRILLSVDDADLSFAQIDVDHCDLQLALRDGAPFHLVPPIHISAARLAPSLGDAGFVRYWAEHFAQALIETHALAPGRFAITPVDDLAKLRFASLSDMRAVPDCVRSVVDVAACLSAPPISTQDLGSHGNGGAFRLRHAPSPTASRVKLWRKSPRAGRLPPVLLLYVSGLTMFAVLDGHDRLAAATAEGVPAPLLVLWHLRERPRPADHALQAAVWDAVSQRQEARGDGTASPRERKQDNDLLRSVTVARDVFEAKTRAEVLRDDEADWHERLRHALGSANAKSFLDDCR